MILWARSPKQKLRRRLRALHDRYYDAPSTEVATIAEYLTTLEELRSIETSGKLGGPRLHLGCGEHRMEGWINTDFAMTGAQDVLLDVRRPLPFGDASVRFIHSEDLIEHIDLDDGRRLIEECFRVLEPGGVMRLLTPDATTIVKRVYLDGEPRHLRWCGRELAAGDPCEALNMHFRMNGEHRFLYDYPFLRKTLIDTGFRVTRVRWNESRHRELRFLDLRDFGLNVFVEAEKPRLTER